MVWEEKPSGVTVRELLRRVNCLKTDGEGNKIVDNEQGGVGGMHMLGIE